jgi:glucose/arabinose dehydrogenase
MKKPSRLITSVLLLADCPGAPSDKSPHRLSLPAGFSSQVFAEGVGPAVPPPTPDTSRFRPMGLAQTEDGALLIIDSKQGRIWKIRYQG